MKTRYFLRNPGTTGKENWHDFTEVTMTEKEKQLQDTKDLIKKSMELETMKWSASYADLMARYFSMSQEDRIAVQPEMEQYQTAITFFVGYLKFQQDKENK